MIEFCGWINTFPEAQRVSPLPFYHGPLGVPWSLDDRVWLQVCWPSRGRLPFLLQGKRVHYASWRPVKEKQLLSPALSSVLSRVVQDRVLGGFPSRAETMQNVPRLHLSAPFVGQTSLSTGQQAGGGCYPTCLLPCVSWQHRPGAAYLPSAPERPCRLIPSLLGLECMLCAGGEGRQLNSK